MFLCILFGFVFIFLLFFFTIHDLPFTILINSFGSAITFLHFLHVSTFNGSYIGMMIFTFSSELGCSTKILFTSNLFQCPHALHFILSLVFLLPLSKSVSPQVNYSQGLCHKFFFSKEFNQSQNIISRTRCEFLLS